jgi:hypothetical protein
MVDLIKAVHGQRGEVFGRNILHVFGNDFPNMTRRPIDRGFVGTGHCPVIDGLLLNKSCKVVIDRYAGCGGKGINPCFCFWFRSMLIAALSYYLAAG